MSKGTKKYPETGEKIRKLREQMRLDGKKVSQSAFAEYLGLGETTVKAAEAGELSIETLKTIAKACSVSTDHLLGIEEPENSRTEPIIEVMQNHFKVRFENGGQKERMYVTISDSLYDTLKQLYVINTQRAALKSVSEETYRKMEEEIIKAYNASLNDDTVKSTDYVLSECK